MADLDVTGNLSVSGETTLNGPLNANSGVGASQADFDSIRTTLFLFKEGSHNNLPVPPVCLGAQVYRADNHKVVESEELAAGFFTETARNTGTEANPVMGYHKEDDLLGIFASAVYSGGTYADYESLLVGGIAIKAAEDHGIEKYGTKLCLIVTPNGTEQPVVGAVLDEDFTFHCLDFKHHGDQIGFFNADKVEQQELNLSPNPTADEKVDQVIAILKNYGLIKS